MKETPSRPTVIARSNKNSARLSLSLLIYVIPIAFTISYLIFSSYYILILGQHFEHAAVNQALYVMGCIFLGLSFNRQFMSYVKIHGSLLLMHKDHLVYRNALVRIVIPKTEKMEIVQSKFFRLLRIRNENQGHTLPGNFKLTPDILAHLKNEGVRFRFTLVPEILFAGLVLAYYLISTVLPKLGLISSEQGLFCSFGLIACAVVLLTKQDKTKITKKKGLFRLIFLSRHSLQGAAFFGLMMAAFTLSARPLNAFDRQLEKISSLIYAGEYEEVIQLYQSLDSPERSAPFKNNYAWFLSVVPQLELRNPPKAVKLAESAFTIAKNPTTADTYSCALMVSGHKDEALKLATEFKLKNRVEAFNQGHLCSDKNFGSRSLASLRED